MQANIIVFNLRKKINFMNNLLKMVTSSPLSLTGSMKSHIFYIQFSYGMFWIFVMER